MLGPISLQEKNIVAKSESPTKRIAFGEKHPAPENFFVNVMRNIFFLSN
jgi:hypothetical protein